MVSSLLNGTDSSSLPNATISIVIEWENVLVSGDSRASRMLAMVIDQANRIPGCREILNSATKHQPTLEKRPAGLHYELKNLGANEASGDLIVFVDSDVIPESDWLEQLLAPFADLSTQVSCNRTYIEPNSLYNKSFALFWFFPVRQLPGEAPSAGGWTRTQHFFANNIAFRRDTALAHPFPARDATSRGACLELADGLKRERIPIVLNNRALVAHPPPLPGENFTLSALAQGRDRYLRSRRLNRTILGSCWRWGRNSARTLVKIAWLHGQVDLPWLQVPLAWLIGLTYYCLYWLGEVGTMLHLRAVLSITI